jgi:hypothetical protein
MDPRSDVPRWKRRSRFASPARAIGTGALAGTPPGLKELSHAGGLGLSTGIVIALVHVAGILLIGAMYLYFRRLDPDDEGDGSSGPGGGAGGPNGGGPPGSWPPSIRVPEPGQGEIRVVAPGRRPREPVG